MDRLLQLELFSRLADLGSLTKAADSLDLSYAAASRYLSALEDRLSVRLVERTTRKLWLTEAGQRFLLGCQSAIAEIGEAEAAANCSAKEVTGLLRVTCSLSFAVNQIAPALPELHTRYPDLRIELIASNRYQNHLDEGVDLAIRTREYEPDSSITLRRLAETRRILCASPDYLSSRGIPSTPDDLESHDFLVYTLANAPFELRFTRGDHYQTVRVNNSVLASNDGQVLRASALVGHGILVQPLYIVYDDIVAGRLVPILDDWDLPKLIINFAYRNRRYLPNKVRIFIEYMAERFERFDLKRKWRVLPRD